MTPSFPHVPFPKIARYSRECVITEKLDGTNALVYVSDDGSEVYAGSRNRWITPVDDNYGFARWVSQHAEELKTLGPGAHYGEWWGVGIGRGYHLSERRFSLFNVGRWSELNKPACCHVVPTLWTGMFGDQRAVEDCVERLMRAGSVAAPGFMQPEGIVIYHKAAQILLKKLLVGDETRKGE